MKKKLQYLIKARGSRRPPHSFTTVKGGRRASRSPYRWRDYTPRSVKIREYMRKERYPEE